MRSQQSQPISTMLRSRVARTFRIILNFSFAIGLPFAILACHDREAVSSPSVARRDLGGVGVVSDEVMGDFSSVAWAVAQGLADTTLRQHIAVAMKRVDRRDQFGLDLRGCNVASAARDLVQGAARRTQSDARAICNAIRAHHGVTLYMNPDKLGAWNGVTAPIVTAIAEPTRERPSTFRGYLAGGGVVTLPGDGLIPDPVIVVLAADAQNRGRGGNRASLHLRNVPRGQRGAHP